MPSILPLLIPLVLASPQGAADTRFSFHGIFVEGCSCKDACQYELKGAFTKCDAIGAYSFTKGIYGGKSFTGTRVAFASGGTGWVDLYVDGPDIASRQVAADFMSRALKGWGKVSKPVFASVSLTGFDGNYIVNAAGGALRLFCSPAKKKGVRGIPVFENVFNKNLHRKLYQSVTESASYESGGRKIQLQGTNGFFNPVLKETGKL
ncbi:MAG: hypothetical protein HZC36_12350 [Armatimonadetes bacterium]|nr:hypothetical protein [Armatimonadota bacterium]